MRPGGRDLLIALFEEALLEPQEAAGMCVDGQFRVEADPDLFVWIRSFADMGARRRSLAEFYGGPVWARHRDAANATMISSDDVLLLRPVGPMPMVPPSGTVPRRSGVIVATVIDRGGPDEPIVPGSHEGELLATFETEHAENTFPRLPVRTGVDVRVELRRFADVTAARRDGVAAGERQRLVLLPTPGSRLR